LLKTTSMGQSWRRQNRCAIRRYKSVFAINISPLSDRLVAPTNLNRCTPHLSLAIDKTCSQYLQNHSVPRGVGCSLLGLNIQYSILDFLPSRNVIYRCHKLVNATTVLRYSPRLHAHCNSDSSTTFCKPCGLNTHYSTRGYGHVR
jgi:hypothetical protein